MSRGRSSVGVLAAAAVLALALAGCGGSGGKTTTSTAESPSSWAKGFCSSIATWQKSLRSAGSKLAQGQMSKATLDQAASAFEHANTELRNDLDGLGKPPTPKAATVRSELDQLSSELQSSTDEIRKTVAGISGVQGALNAVPQLSSTLKSLGNDLSSTVKQLQSLKGDDQWRQAFADSAACQTVQKSG